MSATVFVDTNVLVYARNTADQRRQSTAEDWLRRLWRERRGRTSIQVLSEYYATVTRKLKPGLQPDEAWDDVRALLAWEPQEIDGSLLLRAHGIERRYRLSWWDSMIVAAAQAQDCALLLTEDLQDGMNFDGVVVCDPFVTKVAETSVDYVPPPLARHRKRGRPRRAA